jgi:putative colanic acid biosysnthesis UDP-glucose lipid carrier transferase
MNTPHRGILRPYSAGFSLLVRLFDGAIIWAGLYLSLNLLKISESFQYQYAALLAIIFYFLTAEASSLFRSARLENYGDIVGKIVFSWVITSLLLIVSMFITKTSADFSRLAMSFWLISTPFLLSTERILIFLVLRRLRTGISNTRSYVILGDSDSSPQLPERIKELAWTGLTYCGHFDNLAALLEVIQSKSIDYVFINYSNNSQDKIIAATQALNDSTALIYLVPDPLLTDLLGSHWIMLGNIPLVIINDHPLYGGWWALKNIEDYVLSIFILILISPLMLLIAMAIKFTSPGPIIFKQRRHGLNGEVITVFKFRTMKTMDDGNVIIQATQDDQRVTSVGKILRRFSLDELPQFFNVLTGDMSIVGPRPHALSHNEYYRHLIDGYMQRHKVKPGITGWAQVNGLRGETDTLEKMQARVEYDMYYINHWSLGLDIKIIFMTIFNGLTGKLMAY